MLGFGIRSRRIFFLAQLGSRSVLGLRISFLGLGLCFLRLGCSFPILGSILGFGGRLFPLAFTLFFLPFNPLALITNLAGSLRSLRERESILDSRGLLGNLWSKGKGRGDGTEDFTYFRMVVYTPGMPPNRVCRDFYNAKGPILCHVTVILAYLWKLINRPYLRLLHAK